jgi:hypothetical protein
LLERLADTGGTVDLVCDPVARRGEAFDSFDRVRGISETEAA